MIEVRNAITAMEAAKECVNQSKTALAGMNIIWTGDPEWIDAAFWVEEVDDKITYLKTKLAMKWDSKIRTKPFRFDSDMRNAMKAGTMRVILQVKKSQ